MVLAHCETESFPVFLVSCRVPFPAAALEPFFLWFELVRLPAAPPCQKEAPTDFVPEAHAIPSGPFDPANHRRNGHSKLAQREGLLAEAAAAA